MRSLIVDGDIVTSMKTRLSAIAKSEGSNSTRFSEALKGVKDELEKESQMIQHLSNILPEKHVYERLSQTSEKAWVLILKGRLNNKQLDIFLRNRKDIIEAVEYVREYFGDSLFRQGPSSPLVKLTEKEKEEVRAKEVENQPAGATFIFENLESDLP